MASRIEAVTVKVLTERNMIEDHFDRNILYGGINKDTPVRALPHFSSHNKLYSKPTAPILSNPITKVNPF